MQRWVRQRHPLPVWSQLVAAVRLFEAIILEYMDFLYLDEEEDVGQGTLLLAAIEAVGSQPPKL